MYNSVFGLLFIFSTFFAATINGKATRESRQLIMIPKPTPLWFPSYDVNPNQNALSLLTPELYSPSPQSRLFGLTSLLAASRQCPTCPTCPPTTTCPTCATCPKMPSLTKFGPSCPTSTPVWSAANGVVGISGFTLPCTIFIAVPAPYTKMQIVCPMGSGFTSDATPRPPVVADLTSIFVTDVQGGGAAQPLTIGVEFRTTGPLASLTFPPAAINSANAFACAWQGFV